jgi:Uma2 family endonuclease
MTIQADKPEVDYPERPEGEEIEKMASLEHGRLGVLLSYYLVAYIQPLKLGQVFDSQTTFKMVGTPPYRQPDVSFVTQARLPASLRVKADFAPDLAVEIVSESDIIFEIEAKIEQYLQSGVKLVWIIYPQRQIVEVYRPETGLIPKIISGSNELDGETVIPGFKLPVKSLFS